MPEYFSDTPEPAGTLLFADVGSQIIYRVGDR